MKYVKWFLIGVGCVIAAPFAAIMAVMWVTKELVIVFYKCGKHYLFLVLNKFIRCIDFVWGGFWEWYHKIWKWIWE